MKAKEGEGGDTFWEIRKILKLEVKYAEVEFYPLRWQKNLITINPLTPNDDYSGRTAPLTSKCCILYIYSTNIGTEYFNHGI